MRTPAIARSTVRGKRALQETPAGRIAADEPMAPQPDVVPFYEPLSTQDRSFLLFEDEAKHMHLGGLALFETGTLATPDGGVDVARIRAHIAARLHLVPRYRQRLAWVPLRARPVWVDDAHFNLAYHVRHTAVPRPGDDTQLKLLVARIMSQQLDRGKPLWEIWIIEGLRDGRFGMLVKVHHALADGVSAFSLFAALLEPAPTERVEAPQPWRPRPAPSAATLLRDQLWRELTAPLRLARDVAGALEDGERVRGELAVGARALWDLIVSGIAPAARTRLERTVGPHRRFEWLQLDLDAVRAVRRRLGGTVNDVVLATVAGAIRTLLGDAGEDVRGLDYRVLVPVNVRREDESGVVGNRASGWLLRLPLHVPSAAGRHAAVRATTRRLKEVRQELGPELASRAIEYGVPGLLSLGIRLTEILRPYNLIVTNVPGPSMPLWFLGARMLGGFPQVPLFESQALGIALFSYCESLCWGFVGDWEAADELRALVAAVSASFDELCAVARVVPAAPAAAAG
jgi:diacylglycerol O-acyltransferase